MIFQLAVDSAIHVVDAIDNFELFAWQSIKGSGAFDGSNDYWLLSA